MKRGWRGFCSPGLVNTTCKKQLGTTRQRTQPPPKWHADDLHHVPMQEMRTPTTSSSGRSPVQITEHTEKTPKAPPPPTKLPPHHLRTGAGLVEGRGSLAVHSLAALILCYFLSVLPNWRPGLHPLLIAWFTSQKDILWTIVQVPIWSHHIVICLHYYVCQSHPGMIQATLQASYLSFFLSCSG